MSAWIAVLAGAVVAGAAFVGIIVAPRRVHLAFLCISVLASSGAVLALGAVARETSAMRAVFLGVGFIIAGFAGGFWAAAAALPQLPTLRRSRPRPVVTQAIDPDRPAVVLLSDAPPERYRFEMTARAVRRYIQTGALDLPSSALPFVFLAERVRYAALHGILPARATVSIHAEAIERALGDRISCVALAWTDDEPTLADAVMDLTAAGAREVCLVTLGADGSLPMNLAEQHALETTAGAGKCPITRAPSIWRHDPLAERLVERVLAAAGGVETAELGVAMIGLGFPEAWSDLDRAWRDAETYFVQRARLMLIEAGLDERRVRTAYLEWREPDVTECVRHLAALGAKRIVVVPATIPVAVLPTALDIDRAVHAARLPLTTQVITLTPWGDDPALTEALVSVIASALDHREAPQDRSATS